jgi:hypothetical protein
MPPKLAFGGILLTCSEGLALQELHETVYGNPHSVTPSSTRATQAVEHVRQELLKFFGADPKEYEARLAAVSTPSCCNPVPYQTSLSDAQLEGHGDVWRQSLTCTGTLEAVGAVALGLLLQARQQRLRPAGLQ